MTKHTDERLLRPQQLAPEEAVCVIEHLARCARCRRHYKATGAVLDALLYALADAPVPVVPAPPGLWSRIEVAVDATEQRHEVHASQQRRARLSVRLVPARPAFFLGIAAVVLLVLMGGGAVLLLSSRTPSSAPTAMAAAPRPSWVVATLEGERSGNLGLVRTTTRLVEGERLETGRTGRARLEVDSLGHVELAPRSRVRLVAAKAPNGQRRLALERGTLHATIIAPPRLFVVETPSALAVDLGCAYSLTVDDTGASVLRVTAGHVVLEGRRLSHHAGRAGDGFGESLVPAGAVCVTRPGSGPGTPYFADAGPTFRDALKRWDFAGGGASALRVVLSEARPKDSLTLWHLLERAPPAYRPTVYNRLTRLVTPPPGVTRAGVLRGDPAMRADWHDLLMVQWWQNGPNNVLLPVPAFDLFPPRKENPR